MATLKDIKEAQKMAKEIGARGIRILSDEHDDYGKLSVGDTALEPSSVWVDGYYTDERLDGVSAISRDAYLSHDPGYRGDEIVLLGASSWDDGQDEGEIVIARPTVLAVYRI